jgi:hypothetical protein
MLSRANGEHAHTSKLQQQTGRHGRCYTHNQPVDLSTSSASKQQVPAVSLQTAGSMACTPVLQL